MSLDKQRNGVLDQNKLIAAFFVILLHSPFPGIVGVIFESLARFAVPFFFMISGYYVYEKSQNAIKKSLLKNLLLLVSSLSLYVVWELAWSLLHGNVAEKLGSWISVKSIIDIFVFNNGTLLGHLWFILALVYCYLIYFAVNRLSFKIKLIISIILLMSNFVVDIVLREVGVADPGYFTRTFLLTGLPFFIIGELFAYGKIPINGKKIQLWIMLAIGVILTLLQRFFLGFRELYFGSVLICISLFALSITQQMHSNGFLVRSGHKVTTGVYILHVMIIACLNMVGSVLGVLQSNAFLILRPFVTLLLSVFASCVIYVVKMKITSRRVDG